MPKTQTPDITKLSRKTPPDRGLFQTFDRRQRTRPRETGLNRQSPPVLPQLKKQSICPPRRRRAICLLFSNTYNRQKTQPITGEEPTIIVNPFCLFTWTFCPKTIKGMSLIGNTLGWKVRIKSLNLRPWRCRILMTKIRLSNVWNLYCRLGLMYEKHRKENFLI